GMSLLGVKMQNAMGGADRLRPDHPARLKLDEASKPIAAATNEVEMAKASTEGLTNQVPGIEQSIQAATDRISASEAMWRVVKTVCACERKPDCNIPPAEEDLATLKEKKIEVVYYPRSRQPEHLAYVPQQGEAAPVDQLIVDVDANVGGDCITSGGGDLD